MLNLGDEAILRLRHLKRPKALKEVLSHISYRAEWCPALLCSCSFGELMQPKAQACRGCPALTSGCTSSELMQSKAQVCSGVLHPYVAVFMVG